jgi:hypothetical protein
MPKYRKKPVVIDAEQWRGHGDNNPLIKPYHPVNVGVTCEICGILLSDHGGIETLEGIMKVCPKDFIITGIQGERYCCKQDIFYRTYDMVEE